MNDLISASELSQRFNISRQTEWRWRKKIRHFKINRRVYYSQEAIEEFLMSREVPPETSGSRQRKVSEREQ
ncbi:MAG: helix-turn-helix domain-containing protein [Blastocatellia bacterium]